MNKVFFFLLFFYSRYWVWSHFVYILQQVRHSSFSQTNMSTQVITFQEEVSPGRILTMPTDGTGLSVLDPWLTPYNEALRQRYWKMVLKKVFTLCLDKPCFINMMKWSKAPWDMINSREVMSIMALTYFRTTVLRIENGHLTRLLLA